MSDAIRLSDCHFYHSMDLPISGSQAGVWDLRGRFEDYTGHVDFSGKSVLDVGTASGYLSFEAEKRGATVTSFDAPDWGALRMLPLRDSKHTRDPDAWRVEADTWLAQLRNAYRLAHEELGSQAECRYGNIYDLDPADGTFDIVMLGQILIHLPDGISAVAAAASVCDETIVITEGSTPVADPIALLAGRADLPEVDYAWYQYSHGWYREVLAMLGFTDVTITTDTYRCNHEFHEPMIELATVIGTR
jgi:SAM-dependent methyltransferase